jgi:hypothetical protein
MFVSCERLLLSGGDLCGGQIPRPEESYRLCCVSECHQVKINNLDTCCEWVEDVRTTKRNEADYLQVLTELYSNNTLI